MKLEVQIETTKKTKEALRRMMERIMDDPSSAVHEMDLLESITNTLGSLESSLETKQRLFDHTYINTPSGFKTLGGENVSN